MSDLLFDFDTTRSEFSDAAYAAIGRALAFATRFEANCRALAALIGVREAMKARGASDGESLDISSSVLRRNIGKLGAYGIM
jgi:hypothetical protein